MRRQKTDTELVERIEGITAILALLNVIQENEACLRYDSYYKEIRDAIFRRIDMLCKVAAVAREDAYDGHSIG